MNYIVNINFDLEKSKKNISFYQENLLELCGRWTETRKWDVFKVNHDNHHLRHFFVLIIDYRNTWSGN